MFKLINDIKFPTEYDENFRLSTFQLGDNYALTIYKNINENDTIPLRIHSECKTGETFLSLKCDCKEQLDNMLKLINTLDKGMIIYLLQEGRGIGLINKIDAYSLQDKYNFDTFYANSELNLDIDSRNYDICNEILNYFKIKNVVLFTNNKSKFKTIKKKYSNMLRVPVLSTINTYNCKYIYSKNNHSNYYKFK